MVGAPQRLLDGLDLRRRCGQEVGLRGHERQVQRADLDPVNLVPGPLRPQLVGVCKGGAETLGPWIGMTVDQQNLAGRLTAHGLTSVR